MYRLLFCILLLLFSCQNSKENSKDFKFYFNEKTMIFNQEEENQIEGKYLTIKKLQKNELHITIPKYFTNKNYKNWKIGWGNDEILQDNGCENLATIDSINFEKNIIYKGKQIRGSKSLRKNDRVVFWNFNSNDFQLYNYKEIINLKDYPGFSGNSISFGGIVYDKSIKAWVILFQECDHPKRQIYAAKSKNLIDWLPLNEGNPILTYHSFKTIKWANQNYIAKQTPWLSDIFIYKNQFHFLFNGTFNKNFHSIGIAKSKSISSNFSINKEAILSPGYLTSWNNRGCFNAKITKNKNQFLIVYDGINDLGEENVGIAFSKDLLHWKNSQLNPIISNHSGWRSKLQSSEPDYVSWKNDSIIIVVSGTKKTNNDLLSHYIYRNMYKSKSGNIEDAQLGVYLSTDNGKTFYPHKNNPVIINDYSYKSENEHMGGNIKFIETDSLTYFFYQVKNSDHHLKYSIHLRTKRK